MRALWKGANDVSEFKASVEKSVGKSELQMAKQLIESMTTEWEPEQYTDEDRGTLENLIEAHKPYHRSKNRAFYTPATGIQPSTSE